MDSKTIEEICEAVITAFSVGGVVIMSPALLAWLGFTTTGITAGSIAAYLMSLFGPTWLIAMLQSAGAAGLGWLGTSVSALAGGAMGKIISTVCNVTVKNEL